MTDTPYLHTTLNHGLGGRAVTVTRLQHQDSDSVAQPQTLLIANAAVQEVVLEEHGRINFGPRTPFGPVLSSGKARPREEFDHVLQAIWDPFSSSVVFVTLDALILMADDYTLYLLAGGRAGASANTDGNGETARFQAGSSVATDGAGCLYVADGDRIRKVRLPPSLAGRWHSAATAGDVTAAVPDIAVTTLPFQAPSNIIAMIYQPGPDGSASVGGTLVYTTDCALYRVALPANTGGGQGATATQPELLAGAEGEEDDVDGPGPSARFEDISDLVTDSRGCIFINDRDLIKGDIKVRKVEQQPAVGGGPVNVTTLVDTVNGEDLFALAILPCGYLALSGHQLAVIDLKLQPAPLTASATVTTAAGPPPRTLPDDLGALLDPSDETSDITLLVGDRSFAAHRAILAARSDYFKQRLTGAAFADSGEQQLPLPHTNPEAFMHVQRYMYTGRFDTSLPGPLLRSVAELADRLLLPELCREAQVRVLAEVSVENVVDCLLWAESRGGGGTFSQLLADLKAWYWEHEDEVKERARPSLKRLMEEASDIALELLFPNKRARRQ